MEIDNETKQSSLFILLASLVTAIGIFILDLLLPLGVAAGVPYVGLVLISLYSSWRNYPIVLASISSILILLGFLLSPSLGIPWIVITNRLLAVIVIWMTAEFCRRRLNVVEEMKKAEDFPRAILKSSPDYIFVLDSEAVVLMVNRIQAGHIEQDVVGQKATKFIPAKYHQTFEEAFRKVADSGELETMETVLVFHGQEHFYLNRLKPVAAAGKEGLVVLIITDITVRKQAEYALSENENKYRTLFEQSADAILMLEEGQFIDCNDAAVKMLGYKNRQQLIETHPSQLSPELQPDGQSSFNKADIMMEMAVAKGSHRFEWDHKRQNGQVFPVEVLLTAVPFQDKIFLHTVWRDITVRKRAEKALHESENKYRNLVESSPFCIHQIDSARKIMSMNQTGLRMLNVSDEASVIGLPYLDAVCKNDRKRISNLLEKAYIGESSEFEFTGSDGTEYRSNFVPIYDANKIVDRLFGITQDITELKRLQKLESRASRLEIAGTVAGQVAHDFNNLLAPLMAYPEFIRDKLPVDHPTLKYLGQIEKAAQKIADINQQLLTLGRRGHYNHSPINLNTIISQAVSELKPCSEQIICKTELAPELNNILGGDSQIHRVIANLLHNAVDAIQDTGQVSIRTENYFAHNVSGVYGRVPKGRYIKLTITDTGVGMADEIVQKILDPFFTTKASDQKRGSGLGLSVVDAVVKDHNGYLDLETALGRGTSFYLYFPVTDLIKEADNIEKPSGGCENLLVVDDDKIQREVSCQLLKRLGYAVSAVASGEEAVEFLKDNPQDLLLLDMIMPGGIDGTETYQQILKNYPHQKAIIVSGFSESDRVQEALVLGVGAFVKKPLTKKTIAKAVRTELDKEQEALSN